jgi:hypothetical protein
MRGSRRHPSASAPPILRPVQQPPGPRRCWPRGAAGDPAVPPAISVHRPGLQVPAETSDCCFGGDKARRGRS